MRGSSGPRSMPCGAASSRASVRPSGVGPEAVAVGTGCAASSRASARARAAARAPPAAPAASRPASGEAGSWSSRCIEAADHEVVERLDVGVRALSGGDAGQPQERVPLGRHGRVRARGPRASSWPRCGRRAGRARGRSGSGGAARAPAGSRPRGASSRSRRCRRSPSARATRAHARRRPAFGVLTAGLPANVNSARIWPSPGRVDLLGQAGDRAARREPPAGRARGCASGRAGSPCPCPGVPRVFAAPAAACVNIAPPGRSRLPVSTLSTSTSQLASVPNSWVQVPIRP